MTDVRTLRRSFAGGEITPELFGRLDLTKFQTGLALARNFITLPHGPAVTRPGTRFVREVKYSDRRTRLIPFVLSDVISYVLEFGHQYIRFHSGGGTVLEPSSPKTCSAVNTNVLPNVFTVPAHGFANGAKVVPTGFDGVGSFARALAQAFNNGVYVVRNATTDTFTLERANGSPFSFWTEAPPPGSAIIPGAFDSAEAAPYEVASPYDEAHLFDLHYAQATGVLTLVHPEYEPRELRIIAPDNWTLTVIDFDSPVAAPTNLVASVDGPGPGTDARAYWYAVTAVDDAGQESLASATGFVQNDLWVAGHRNALEWDRVPGAAKYNVYKASMALGGGVVIPKVMGFIGTSADNGLGDPGFVDQNIEPDFSISPPENYNPFDGAGNWPTATAYFEQRRVFGGTKNNPQTLWLTRSGHDSNMARSLPIRDDDSIEFRIAAREANNIKHVVPFEQLLLFTGSAVWRVWSQDSDALTPSTISVRPTAYVGASNVQPVVAGNSVLFEEVRSGHLSELRYSWESNGYVVSDASLLAPHLVDGFALVELAYTTAPYKIAWAVRNDGTLLGMTYVPEQQVLGWHHHDTNGAFESCAAVPEGVADGLYVVVRRTINGSTRRYIERLQVMPVGELEDAFYVDSGLTYRGAPATTISGLNHLEGQEVAILADGAVLPRQVVNGGSVTLENAASVVHVGLPITFDFQTLPLEYEVAGQGLGVAKNINRVHLRVYRSSSIFAGPTFEKLKQFKQRTTEPYGSPPGLLTGVASFAIDPQWNTEGQLCVRQTDPLPLAILSLSMEVTVGD